MTSEDWNPATAKEDEPPEMLLSYADLRQQNDRMRKFLTTIVMSRCPAEVTEARMDARTFLEATKTP